MKKIIILLLVLISFLNCKQKEGSISVNKNDINKEVQKQKNDTITDNLKSDVLEIQNVDIYLDTLIPIVILDKKSKNSYKKYGLEFGGNCYACDLAQFKIDNREISIFNVCDNQNKLNFEILKLENTKNKIEIETQNYKFTFIKIEHEPIYKLKIINYNIQNKDLRISEYFTFKKNLMKFEVHNCGDFDG